MVGMSRDVTSDATANAGATWMIVNGVVQVVPLVGYLPGEAVVLNFKTGLIGWPEATESGLYARCLLNPAIKCQGQVQINNASVNQTIVNPNTSGGLGGFVGPGSAFPDANLQGFATVTNDGFYRVLVVEHEGDTRGQPWYTNLVCLALDTSAPGGGQTTDQTTTVPAGSETIESINITTPTS